MLYGIILDTVRDSILRTYGATMWKRVVAAIDLPMETFDLFSQYDEFLLIKICDSLVELLNEGTRNQYLEYFGKNFIHYFYRNGFSKLFRVAGRTFRDFLFVIDQMHDSNRFIFPHMKRPTFHVVEEDVTGAILLYKSQRCALTHFAIGGLKAIASVIFDQNDIHVFVEHDVSTDRNTHVIMRVQFDNTNYKIKRLLNFPLLPDLSGTTFLRIFPYSVIMDSSFRIFLLGKNLVKIFPENTPLIGRLLNEVFQNFQPEFDFQLDKLITYGQRTTFSMENRLQLCIGSSGKIRLKGQMKYLKNKRFLCFLCHPVLDAVDDIISAGLRLNDLSLFDSTHSLLFASTNQAQQIKETNLRQHQCSKQILEMRKKISKYYKRNQQLLCSTVPKHIATLLLSGIEANSISECQPLVTIMMIKVEDLKMLMNHLDASHTVTCLNRIIALFDNITDRFQVFKVEVKVDGNYMVVAGIIDQTYASQTNNGSQLSMITTANGDEGEEDKQQKEKQNTQHNLSDDSDISELNPTEVIAALSLEILHASERIYNPVTNKPFNLKFGIHTGMAIGGILGTHSYQYCLFGETVRIANLMASTSEIGRIHVSQTAYGFLVLGANFMIEHRGQVEISPNMNPVDAYWLTGVNMLSSKTKINKYKTIMACPSGNLDLVFKQNILNK